MLKSFRILLAAGLLALLGGCVYGPDYGYVRADGYYGDAWYGSGGYYGPSYYSYGWYTPSYYYGYPRYGYWGGYYGSGYYGHSHRGQRWDGGSYPDYYSRSRDYPGSPRPPGYSGSTTRGQPPVYGGNNRGAPSTFSNPAPRRAGPSSAPTRSSGSRAPRPSVRTRDR
ncbi:MAG: hypothetical protein J0H15_00470 [Xanthomonadales bacterium]|nr:hypothetical protein [Xanthomonadales bacterium]